MRRPQPLVAQRPKLSRFGPREGRASKRIRRWAEVGSSIELGVLSARASPRADDLV